MEYLTKERRPGTYVVSMRSSAIGIRKFDAGCIAMVIDHISIRYDGNTYLACERNIKEGTIKWFETLEEAEAFSKSMLVSLFPPDIPKTKTFDDFGIDPEMEYECDIINSWQTHGENRWDDPKVGWEKSTGHAYGNRKLSKIQLKDGVYALYVKGSSNTWIRAEGFIQYYRAELLKMAIKRYPIGTNYCSAFDGTADGECTETPYWSGDDAISGGSRYIWHKGKWGRIFGVPKQEETKEKWAPKVGDWVKIVSLTSKDGRSLTGIIGYVYQIGEINDGWYSCTQETYFIGRSMPIECIASAEPPNTETVNTPKEQSVEQEFKVGDVVTITSWHFHKIPLPQKGIIKEIGKSDQLTPYQIELSKSSETEGATYSAGSSWWFKPGEFVKQHSMTWDPFIDMSTCAELAYSGSVVITDTDTRYPRIDAHKYYISKPNNTSSELIHIKTKKQINTELNVVSSVKLEIKQKSKVLKFKL
jgi:hypothetical protein